MTTPTPQYRQVARARRARKRADVVIPNAWALLPTIALARAVGAGAAAYLRVRTALSPAGVWWASTLAGGAVAIAAQFVLARTFRQRRAARAQSP